MKKKAEKRSNFWCAIIVALIGAVGSIIAAKITVSDSKELFVEKGVMANSKGILNTITIGNGNNNTDTHTRPNLSFDLSVSSTEKNVDVDVEGDSNVITIGNGNNNINTYVGYSSSIDSYSNNELLQLADAAYDDNNYEKLFEICILNRLQDDPKVLYNLGYLYLNGLYVKEDFDKARYYFELSNSVDGKRGLLALAIRTYNKEEIDRLLHELVAEADLDTWDYMCYCETDKSFLEMSRDGSLDNGFSYSYENFYRYEDTYRISEWRPNDTFFERWIFMRLNSQVVPIYKSQKIMYYSLINKYIRMEEPLLE